MIKKLDQTEYLNRVIEEKETVLIDFYASWCGPCKMYAPTLEVVSEHAPISFYKMDIDEVPSIAESLKIMSVPTVKIFQAGKEIASMTGVRNEKDLQKFIENSISNNI